MSGCTLCPRRCGVDRSKRTGFCGMGVMPKVARTALHFWEEPCISGRNGSGTVFFSGCTLRCAYCQNHEISHLGQGKEITVQRLADIFKMLRDQGAHNINLVTATPFVPAVLDALSLFHPGIPIVWNSGGYETVDTLKMLQGAVDFICRTSSTYLPASAPCAPRRRIILTWLPPPFRKCAAKRARQSMMKRAWCGGALSFGT